MTNNPPTAGLDLLLSPWAPREPLSNSHELHVIPYSTLNSFSVGSQPTRAPKAMFDSLEPWSNTAIVPDSTHVVQPLSPIIDTPAPGECSWKCVNEEMYLQQRSNLGPRERIPPAHSRDEEYKCMWGPESEWCGQHLRAGMRGPQFVYHLKNCHGIGPEDFEKGQKCRWRVQVIAKGDVHLDEHECGVVHFKRKGAVQFWRHHILRRWKHLWFVRDSWSEMDSDNTSLLPTITPAPDRTAWRCVNQEMYDRIALDRPAEVRGRRPLHVEEQLYKCLWGPDSEWCGQMLSSRLTDSEFLGHFKAYHGVGQASSENGLECRWRVRKHAGAPESECGLVRRGRGSRIWKFHILSSWRHVLLVPDDPVRENAQDEA